MTDDNLRKAATAYRMPILTSHYAAIKKESKMENHDTTMLALQVMNGVKIFAVKINGQSTQYHYKSMDSYAEDDYVVVQTSSGVPVVGRVLHEVTTPDYSGDRNYRWILTAVPDFAEALDKFTDFDNRMHEKLAKAKAISAAKALLENAGVDVSEFSAEAMQAALPNKGANE